MKSGIGVASSAVTSIYSVVSSTSNKPADPETVQSLMQFEEFLFRRTMAHLRGMITKELPIEDRLANLALASDQEEEEEEKEKEPAQAAKAKTPETKPNEPAKEEQSNKTKKKRKEKNNPNQSSPSAQSTPNAPSTNTQAALNPQATQSATILPQGNLYPKLESEGEKEGDSKAKALFTDASHLRQEVISEVATYLWKCLDINNYVTNGLIQGTYNIFIHEIETYRPSKDKDEKREKAILVAYLPYLRDNLSGTALRSFSVSRAKESFSLVREALAPYRHREIIFAGLQEGGNRALIHACMFYEGTEEILRRGHPLNRMNQIKVLTFATQPTFTKYTDRYFSLRARNLLEFLDAPLDATVDQTVGGLFKSFGFTYPINGGRSTISFDNRAGVTQFVQNDPFWKEVMPVGVQEGHNLFRRLLSDAAAVATKFSTQAGGQFHLLREQYILRKVNGCAAGLAFSISRAIRTEDAYSTHNYVGVEKGNWREAPVTVVCNPSQNTRVICSLHFSKAGEDSSISEAFVEFEVKGKNFPESSSLTTSASRHPQLTPDQNAARKSTCLKELFDQLREQRIFSPWHAESKNLQVRYLRTHSNREGICTASTIDNQPYLINLLTANPDLFLRLMGSPRFDMPKSCLDVVIPPSIKEKSHEDLLGALRSFLPYAIQDYTRNLQVIPSPTKEDKQNRNFIVLQHRDNISTTGSTLSLPHLEYFSPSSSLSNSPGSRTPRPPGALSGTSASSSSSNTSAESQLPQPQPFGEMPFFLRYKDELVQCASQSQANKFYDCTRPVVQWSSSTQCPAPCKDRQHPSNMCTDILYCPAFKDKSTHEPQGPFHVNLRHAAGDTMGRFTGDRSGEDFLAFDVHVPTAIGKFHLMRIRQKEVFGSSKTASKQFYAAFFAPGDPIHAFSPFVYDTKPIKGGA